VLGAVEPAQRRSQRGLQTRPDRPVATPIFGELTGRAMCGRLGRHELQDIIKSATQFFGARAQLESSSRVCVSTLALTVTNELVCGYLS